MSDNLKNILKELNRSFFDKHISDVRWSKEKDTLTILMDTKEKFEFTGEEAKQLYKKLTY